MYVHTSYINMYISVQCVQYYIMYCVCYVNQVVSHVVQSIIIHHWKCMIIFRLYVYVCASWSFLCRNPKFGGVVKGLEFIMWKDKKLFPRKQFLLSLTLPLKGQSHEIFCTQFFHQSVHSGPIRDVIGPFFLLLYRVIALLIWLHGTLETGESQLPGTLDTRESQLPGIQRAGESLFF